MLLVSVEDYQNLRKQLFYSQTPELTQDLYKVKDATEHLPPDQQLALQSEVLRQHVQQNTPQPSSPPPPTPAVNDDVVTNNLNSFSRMNKIRANQIYQHLKAHKTQWNEMGQLLNEHNEPIPNSNIVELIDYVTNTKRTARLPAGFGDFLELVHDSQLPRHYLSTLGNSRVTDYKHLKDVKDDAADDEQHTSMKTSAWKRLKRLQHT